MRKMYSWSPLVLKSTETGEITELDVNLYKLDIENKHKDIDEGSYLQD